jgi:acyl-CoA synthetase (NDP forming)
MTTTQRRATNLDAIFEARSVAVVGASANPRKHGHRLVANLKSGDPDRVVYPITRSREPILGFESYGALSELPAAPDLVLVSVPAEGVPDVIDEAVTIGARAAIVFACGFAEAGAAGGDLQRRITDSLRGSDLRLVGPNCMGIYDAESRLKATYYTQLPAEGGMVGFISQSGAFAGVALTELVRSRVGISRFASIGNMADVTHAELIRYLGADERTRVIAAFIEGIPDGAELLDSVTETSAAKPVVILKGARTQSGQVAAASHTGAMAGDARVWEALLREAGAIVAEDTDDLFDTASALARIGNRRPRGNRVGMVTISGGPAVVAADAVERRNLSLPDLRDELEEITPLVPEFASLANPVDDPSGELSPGSREGRRFGLCRHAAGDQRGTRPTRVRRRVRGRLALHRQTDRRLPRRGDDRADLHRGGHPDPAHCRTSRPCRQPDR